MGACRGRGSELNSWGLISNALEFIYAVNCWGRMKRMGLPGERVRAELVGIDFETFRIHLRWELSDPCEKDWGLQGERV